MSSNAWFTIYRTCGVLVRVCASTNWGTGLILASAPLMAILSLLEHCKNALVALIICDPRKWIHVLTLPPDLLASVLASLTPVALKTLQDQMGSNCSDSEEDIRKTRDAFLAKRKYAEMGCASQCCFNSAWKIQISKRWPAGLKQRYHYALSSLELDVLGISEVEANADWQQRYWEAHLQECLNEAAAQASAPFFEGSIGDVILPGTLLQQIGVELVNAGHETFSVSECPTLKYHCWHFGQYARYLRLRSVLCSSDLTNLLLHARLQHVALHSVSSPAHVEGLCQLLGQKKESLQAVELHHCRLSSAALDEVAKSLVMGDEPNYMLKHIFVFSSSISIQDDQVSNAASGFLDLLHSCRFLHSVVLSDNELDSLSASRIVLILLQAVNTLAILRVSENELEGLFAKELARLLPSIQCSNVHRGPLSFQLKVLDLRSNLLDSGTIADLCICLKFMPLLQKIDLSDNLIGDDGIRALLPYLREISVLDFNVSACGLSSVGASLLLEVLLPLKHPLKHLSMAHNSLGRSIAVPLADFLTKGLVEKLDIGDIELGPSGCLELEEAISHTSNLKHLIICKNRIGASGAALLCKLISKSGALTVVDSSWNLLDFDTLKRIALELEVQGRTATGGRLELLDLRGNPVPEASKLFENVNGGGKLLVLLSYFDKQFSQWHDDDP